MRVWIFAYFLITFALVPFASSFKPMAKLNRQIALGLEVTSKGFDLTDSLKSHIDKKIGDIVKSLKNEAVSSHVHIKANNGFSQPGISTAIGPLQAGHLLYDTLPRRCFTCRISL